VVLARPGDSGPTSNAGCRIDQRGRWRLRREGHGRTRTALRLAYGVAGSGILGWVAEQLAAPIVRAHVRRTLHELKRTVEQQQTRAAAARRA
jgi:uncharacterized membrane protein